MRTFEDPGFHDRLSLAQQGAYGSAPLIVAQVLALLQAAILLVGFSLALLSVNPILFVIVMIAATPALVGQLSLSSYWAHTQWRMSGHDRRRAALSMMQVDEQAAKEIRIFGFGIFLRDRMRDEVKLLNRAESLVNRRQFRIELGTGLLSALVTGGGLIYAVALAATGRLEIGDVSLFVAAVAGVQGGLGGIVQSLAQLQRSLSTFEHYEAVLQTPPDVELAKTPRRLERLGSKIEFRGVWFRYDSAHPWVLRDFHASFAAHSTTALIGLNGAGKTTIVKLLLRFYDPDRGAILWDGVDVREIDIQNLRSRMSAVFQDFMRYDLTARENIAVGDISGIGDDGRLRQAASEAGLDQRLDELPRGYDTMLTKVFWGPEGEGVPGVRLSGGEWQRIAIARSLMRADADVIILDEASSGLDAVAEYQLHQQLRHASRGKTTIAISHRLSAIRDADHLLVIENGSVVEQGSHGDLMARCGTYARLFSLQASGYAEGPGLGGGLSSATSPSDPGQQTKHPSQYPVTGEITPVTRIVAFDAVADDEIV
ncbi:MAG TPA: ABC transporter ATP-binding protein [Candidatus Dormibacteraeota bacterium]|nr:ABC transporter ATP-binding protein [Candidatus Dormibacteraeota bacterium]